MAEGIKQQPYGNCGDCVLWQQQNNREGLCRATAPRSHIVGEGGGDFVIKTVWPRTDIDDWCGRWRRR
jgi:hypothetical protein